MSLTPDEGRDLAAQIRRWLRSSRQAKPSTELAAFTDDIENCRNISTWAGVNYERILPLRYQRTRVAIALSVLRNSLVFVPVLLTWWALRAASSGYANYVDSLPPDRAAASNFLQYWQGLDGLSRFSTVATIDASVIAGLVVLTLVVGWSEVASRSASQLESQHAGLMVSLERALSGYRYLTLADINAVVQGTVRALLESAERVEDASRSLAAVANEALTAVQGIQSLTGSSFVAIMQKLDAAVQGLDLASKSHQEMAQLVTDNRNGLATQLDATRLGFATIVQNVHIESQKILDTVGNQLAGAVASISQTSHVVATDLAVKTSGELAGVGGTVRNAADYLATVFTEISHELRDASTRMRETLSTLEFGIGEVRGDLEAVHDRLRDVAAR